MSPRPGSSAHRRDPESQTGASREAIAISDKLIDEFLAADRYVIGVPMYNFNIPSTLKAWIDQIVRAGKTFAVGPTGFRGAGEGEEGALHSRPAAVVYTPGTPAIEFNFQEPYLRTIFKFIGVTDVRFVTADGMNQGVDMAAKARAPGRAGAGRSIDHLVSAATEPRCGRPHSRSGRCIFFELFPRQWVFT